MILSQSLILIFVYPYETPKYLLSLGKEEEARKLLHIVYKEEFLEEILHEKRLDLESLNQGYSK